MGWFSKVKGAVKKVGSAVKGNALNVGLGALTVVNPVLGGAVAVGVGAGKKVVGSISGSSAGGVELLEGRASQALDDVTAAAVKKVSAVGVLGGHVAATAGQTVALGVPDKAAEIAALGADVRVRGALASGGSFMAGNWKTVAVLGVGGLVLWSVVRSRPGRA